MVFPNQLMLGCIFLLAVLGANGSAARDAALPTASQPNWAGPAPEPGRGFYEEPFEVSFPTATGQRIYYTTDGTKPSEARGRLYSGPIPIRGTTVLRAVVTAPGVEPSKVTTHSYIFLRDVLAQAADPPGFPAAWGRKAAGDYAFDAGVGSKTALRESLRGFPSVSLVMPVGRWFEARNDPRRGGIYANAHRARGRDWERAVSVEFLGFAHGQDLQIDAGIRIYGNASRQRSRPKHNLRLIFREAYGEGKLDFPVFGDDDVRDRVNSLLLRGQNGDSWVVPRKNPRRQALYLRDQLTRTLHARMGHPEIRHGHLHVYLNGLYWGLFNSIERLESRSMAERFGGQESEWDVLKASSGAPQLEVVDGSLDAWLQLQELARRVGAGEARLAAVEELVDLDHLIDFLLLNFYVGNRDWDRNNFQAVRRRVPGSRWRFFVWDAEATLRGATDNATEANYPNRTTSLHNALLPLAGYRARFTARARKHLTGRGALTPGKVEVDLLGWVRQLRIPLLAESGRWGDAHRPGEPYEVSIEWQTEVDRLLREYIPDRTDTVIRQLRAMNLMR